MLASDAHRPDVPLRSQRARSTKPPRWR